MSKRWYFLIWLFALAALSACKQRVASTNGEITILGLKSFGNVIIGDSISTQVLLINESETSTTIKIESTSSDLAVSASAPSGCHLTSLQPNTPCILSITLSPTSKAFQQMKISINDQYVFINGSGINPAILSYTPDTIPLGTVTAGSISRYQISLTNNGDVEDTYPTITASALTDITVESTTCQPRIQPGVTCLIDLAISPHTKNHTYNNIVTFTSAAQSLAIPITGVINSGPAYGSLTISNLQDIAAATIHKDASDGILVVSNPIVDQFNNVVEDTEVITIRSNNADLSLCTQISSSTTTSDFSSCGTIVWSNEIQLNPTAGVVSFSIRGHVPNPTTSAEAMTLSLSTTESLGSLVKFLSN